MTLYELQQLMGSAASEAEAEAMAEMLKERGIDFREVLATQLDWISDDEFFFMVRGAVRRAKRKKGARR